MANAKQAAFRPIRRRTAPSRAFAATESLQARDTCRRNNRRPAAPLPAAISIQSRAKLRRLRHHAGFSRSRSEDSKPRQIIRSYAQALRQARTEFPAVVLSHLPLERRNL